MCVWIYYAVRTTVTTLALIFTFKVKVVNDVDYASVLKLRSKKITIGQSVAKQSQVTSTVDTFEDVVVIVRGLLGT